MNLILIQSLALPVCLASDTVTSSTSPAPPSFTATCSPIEEKLRQFILRQIDNGRNSLTRYKLYDDCLEGLAPTSMAPVCAPLNKANLANIKKYREDLAIIYKRGARAWIEEEPSGLAKFCFQDVEFDHSIRSLKIKRHALSSKYNKKNNTYEDVKLPDPACQTILTRWHSERDQFVADILSGRKKTSFFNDEQELKNFSALFYSPLGMSLSAEARYGLDVSEEVLRKQMAIAFQSMSLRIDRFRKNVHDLKPHQLWFLYSFQNLNSGFLTTLSDQEKTVARHCSESTSFLQDCSDLGGVVPNAEDASFRNARCLNRLKYETPILGVIPSFRRLQHFRAVFEAGLSTPEEVFLHQTTYIMMGFSALFPL